MSFSGTFIRLLPVTALLAGCGSAVAPTELHTARDAFKKAETSAAPQLAPVQLDEARQALTKAETAFKDGGDDQDIKDLSYVAQRKAELALSSTNLEQAKRDAVQARSEKETT